jgi:ParB family chromosome partitioning protein
MAIATPTPTTWRTADLTPNPLNPRGPIEPGDVDDLAASIEAQGVLQPLLVTPDGTIVAGHRRHAAALRAGLAEVPVLVRPMTTREQLEIMLVENIQRADLSPLQEAQAYQRLKDDGLTQIDVARRIGVTHARVQTRLVILQLTPEVQELYAQNLLPITLAEPLSKVVDPHQQARFANVAARKQLPAPRIEALIKRSLGEAGDGAKPKRSAPEETAPVLMGPSKTRQELIDLLRLEPESTISFEDLARAMADVCNWCGLDSQPEVCRECPLPRLINRVVAVA